MKGLLGGCLLTAGILIAGTTGLCAFAVLSGGGMTPAQLVQTLPTVLAFAAIPGVIGALLIVAGRRIIRRERDEP